MQFRKKKKRVRPSNKTLHHSSSVEGRRKKEGEGGGPGRSAQLPLPTSKEERKKKAINKRKGLTESCVDSSVSAARGHERKGGGGEK